MAHEGTGASADCSPAAMEFRQLMKCRPMERRTCWTCGRDLMVAPEAVYTFRYVWHELKRVVEARHNGTYNDKPMTGWTATMLALQLCDRVDLYGFMPYTGGKAQRYHYFAHLLREKKKRVCVRVSFSTHKA